MRFRLFVLLSVSPLLLLAALPVAARAAGPGGDVYLGYSHLGDSTFNPDTSGLNGWQAAAQFKFAPLVGLEADVAHYGLGASPAEPHSTTFLFGPRVTVGAAGVHVFAHGLIGAEHSNHAGGILSSNAFTVGAGAGIDFRLAPFLAWRITGDYIDAPSRSTSGDHDRFGTGLVFRF